MVYRSLEVLQWMAVKNLPTMIRFILFSAFRPSSETFNRSSFSLKSHKSVRQKPSLRPTGFDDGSSKRGKVNWQLIAEYEQPKPLFQPKIVLSRLQSMIMSGASEISNSWRKKSKIVVSQLSIVSVPLNGKRRIK
uniref:Uncharacterized protein n=1 Tax=Romanomermis culicivorax TaxID=13658 RepID=A0A915I1L4_ROMCU